ncbi:MAG: Rha family transcriptional regulator [Victivallales bacterium]|nr:Rha family transcriptional regulator [Victivallales bacterium]
MNKSTANTKAAATENNEVKVNQIIDPEQLHVRIIDGKAMVSSRVVAEVFRKRHDNVIRDIESLQVPDTWLALNFEEIKSSSNLGKGRTREYKAYNMTRDGFTILAMGFTGKRAMEFKLAYIEAFNAMELTLRQQRDHYLACTEEWKEKLAQIEIKNGRIMLDEKVLIPESLLFYVFKVDRMDFLAATDKALRWLDKGVHYYEFPGGKELSKLRRKLLNVPFLRPLDRNFERAVYRFWTEEGVREIKEHSEDKIGYWNLKILEELYFFKEQSLLPEIDLSVCQRLKAPKSFERPAGSEEISRLSDKYIELTLLEKDFIKKELLEQWEELTYQQKLDVIVFIERDLRKLWSK